MKAFRTPISILITTIIVLALINPSAPVQAASVGCSSSTAPSGTYQVTICFTNPANGSTLKGNATVTISVSISGSTSGVQHMVFNLNSSYLLTDYTNPYTFTLPTAKWADGSYTLSASAVMPTFTTTQAAITVKFNNGNSSTPVNGNHFTPTSGRTPASGQPFVVAASGDGASGEANAGKVASLVSSLSPNLFLYLGDVYESGSKAEFYNWYGNGSTYFSSLRAITDPTIGNHEYNSGVGGAGYFDYWNNIPNYYSFNAGGWHFISLNSNSSKVGGLTTSSPEYIWLQKDLAAHASTCTIVYYHHPLFNIGKEGSTTALASIWSLMAQYKVSIVLNGHDHDYQRWVPLNGSGAASSSGITEFVAGGGGHGLQNFVKSDSRVAYSNDLNPSAFGVLLLQLGSSGVNFSYHSINGSVLDQGFISCKN